jgi:hypothetical protein
MTRRIPDSLDPDGRYLFRAVNFASMLGILFALIGGVLLVPTCLYPMNVLIAGPSLLAAAGALLIIISVFLGKQQRWALRTAIALTMILIVAFVAGTGLVAWAAFGGSRMALLFLILLIPLIVVQLALLFSLLKCRRLHWFSAEAARGFSVVVPAASDSLPRHADTGQVAMNGLPDDRSGSRADSGFTPPPAELGEEDGSAPRE